MSWVFGLLLAIYIGAMTGMAVSILAVYRRGGEAPPGAIVAYLLLALMGAIIGGWHGYSCVDPNGLRARRYWPKWGVAPPPNPRGSLKTWG